MREKISLHWQRDKTRKLLPFGTIIIHIETNAEKYRRTGGKKEREY